jgi:hypothetical protein
MLVDNLFKERLKAYIREDKSGYCHNKIGDGQAVCWFSLLDKDRGSIYANKALDGLFL